MEGNGIARLRVLEDVRFLNLNECHLRRADVLCHSDRAWSLEDAGQKALPSLLLFPSFPGMYDVSQDSHFV